VTDSPVSPGLLRFGVFEVDLRTGELRKAGRKITIQEQPFKTLLALLDRPGELVTREELRDKVWPADTFVDFDTGLNKAVRKIREALGDSADSPRFVETLPRRGYRFRPGRATGRQNAGPCDEGEIRLRQCKNQKAKRKGQKAKPQDGRH